MKSIIRIIPTWSGTPMKVERSYKWEVEFNSDTSSYLGKIVSENIYDSEEKAYVNLMEQKDDVMGTLLNLSDCTDTYKEQHV